MINQFRKSSLSRQLLILSALTCSVVFTGIVGYTHHVSRESALKQTEKDLEARMDFTVQMMGYTYDAENDKIDDFMKRFKSFYKEPMTLTGKSITVDSVSSPEIKSGALVLNGNHRSMKELKESLDKELDLELWVKNQDHYQKVASSSDGPVSHINETDMDWASLKSQNKTQKIIMKGNNYYAQRVEALKDKNGNIIGAYVLKMDLTHDLEKFKSWLKNVKIAKTGYMFILQPLKGDEIGRYLMHPTFEGKTMKDVGDPSLSERYRKVFEKNGSTEFYVWRDARKPGTMTNKVAVYRPVKGWGWMVGGGSYVDEFVEDSENLVKSLTLMSLLGCILIVSLTSVLIRSRLKKIEPSLHAIEKMGRGDLNQQVEVLPHSQNEADRLGQAINQSSANMRKVLEGIGQTAFQLNGEAQSLEHVSQIAQKSAKTQRAATGEMASSIEELSASVTAIAESATHAKRLAEEVVVSSNKGQNTLALATEDIKLTSNLIEKASQQVEDLGASTAKIFNEVESIRAIADQTNMLALNAAIEAARAGESGRGFAVVADEVRKLAENSKSSTERIEKMMSQAKKEAEEAAREMRAILEAAEEGVIKVTEAGTALVKMSEDAKKASQAVVQIAESTEEQRAASQEIASNVETIAMSADETSGSVETSVNACKTLTKISDDLKSSLNQFIIK